ncbi:hypothetical protein X777_08614, partial [Ooceraea biroi]
DRDSAGSTWPTSSIPLACEGDKRSGERDGVAEGEKEREAEREKGEVDKEEDEEQRERGRLSRGFHTRSAVELRNWAAWHGERGFRDGSRYLDMEMGCPGANVKLESINFTWQV